MKKRILIPVLASFFLSGCNGVNKTEEANRDNRVIDKTYVDILSDDVINSRIVNGNICSFSMETSSNRYKTSFVDSNTGFSDIEFESSDNISDIYIGSSYIYTCEINEDNTDVYVYDFSGEKVFDTVIDSSMQINAVCNDDEHNTYMVYVSESDYKVYMQKYRADGNTEYIYDLSEIINFDDYEEITGIAVDRDNDIYLLKYNYENSKSSLLKYNPELSVCIFQSNINDAGDIVDNIFINESGKLVLSGYDSMYCYVNIIDINSNVSEKYIELQGVQNVFYGENDNLLYTNGNDIISLNILTEEERIVVHTEDTVCKMRYAGNGIVLVRTDDRNTLDYRIADLDNVSICEESFSLDSMYHIHGSCFSETNGLYMLLCNHDTYMLGIFDGNCYSEYEIDFGEYSVDEELFSDFCLSSDDEDIFWVYNNDVYTLNIKTLEITNVTCGEYDSIINICQTDKKLYVMYSKNDGIFIGEYDKSKNEISKLLSLNQEDFSDNSSVLDGSGDYLFFVDYGDELRGYKKDTSFDTLIDWSMEYMPINISSFFVIEKDKYLCISEDDKVYIIENNADKKTVQLDVAFFGLSTASYNLFMQELCEKFELNIKKYSDYSQDGDNGIGQFNLDIASGNIPDVIITSGGFADLDFYREKGLIESLDKYLESDPLIKKEDYMSNVFNLNSFNGSIYYLTPQIRIKTIISKESMGNPEGLNFSEFYKLLNDRYSGYGKDVFGTESNVGLLNYFLSVNKDIQNPSNFEKFDADNDEFRAMLKIAKEYGNNIDKISKLEETMNRFSSDDQVFEIHSFSGFDIYNVYEKCILNDKISFNGISVDKTSEIAIECMNSLCITSSCENKEEAWGLIRTFMLDDYQNSIADQVSFGFPVKNTALTKSLNNSQDPEYVPKNLIVGDTRIPMGYISDETANNFIQKINNCNLKCKADSKIMAIIDEVSLNYFENEFTIDETIEKINQKVNLYLNETK